MPSVTPLQELDALRSQIDAHRPFTPDLVKTLQEHLVPSYLYCSSALGKRTHLTEPEVVAFLEREIVSGGHPLDRYLGLARHRDAFAFVEERAREGRPVELALIRELHHRLVSDSRAKHARPGQWRDHEHPPAQRGTRTFVYTAPDAIGEQMKQLVAGLAERLERQHPVLAMSWFYYQYHLIHPFGLENGAVARLTATCALLHHGYPPLVVDPEQVGELLEALAASAGADQDEVRALAGGERLAPLANFFATSLVRVASELLDLLEGRAVASASDLARQVPSDQGRLLEHMIKSSQANWRIRGVFEVRTLHERLRRVALAAVTQGPLYEIALSESEVGASHRFANTRLGRRLPTADAGVVGDMTLEIRGRPDNGLRLPPPFRLQLVVAGSPQGLHVLLQWLDDEEKITDHHGPPRAVEWPERDLQRLLVQELDERRRRYEMLLLDENLAPSAQARIRQALELAPGQTPRRRTGSFARPFLVDRSPPESLPEAVPAEPARPATRTPGPTPRPQTTMRLDARACPACHVVVKRGEGLTCPDCEAVYHEPCLARLPGCLTASCLAKRKAVRSPRKVSQAKASRATLDGLRPSEPPLSF